jgi:glycosyltransferase involved in cell wall biosynthesis
MNKEKIDVSIVIPVYCNETLLQKLFSEIQRTVVEKNADKVFEFIFVDDGSYDNSLQELIQIRKAYQGNMKIVRFTRNFGQVNAIMAGYRYAKGRCIVNISADLQDPPDLINEMLGYLDSNHYDIVICNRESREETLFRRLASRIFYAIIKRLSFPQMPLGGFDYVLLSARVKDIILENEEANAFFQGQILWTGFKVKFIPYRRRGRNIGESKWTMGKKVKYLIDGVMSYSYFPLRLMSVTGAIVAFLGFLYAAVIFFARMLNNIPVQGWAPLMIVILVLSGFQMLMLGIIGEYLWRTLAQVRGRKQYLIEEIYD